MVKSTREMAEHLKAKTAYGGQGVKKAMLDKISPVAGVDKKRNADKYKWNGKGYKNLSTLLDDMAAHDEANNTDFIKSSFETYVAQKKDTGNDEEKDAPQPQQLSSKNKLPVVIDFSTAIRGTLEAKQQKFKKYLDDLVSKSFKPVAESEFCPTTLKDAIRNISSTPEINDLEAILAIPNLSESTRTASANRLASLRVEMNFPNEETNKMVQDEIARVKILIEKSAELMQLV